jgi:hypothetical protein
MNTHFIFSHSLDTYTGGGGGNRGIQIRLSAQIWSKIRDRTMDLYKSEIRSINKIRKSV